MSAMQVLVIAGPAGHGKTALVRALTGAEPGRGTGERRGSVSSDPGFGWLTLPSGDQLAILDADGADRFVTTVLGNAGPDPAVAFVVAADDGWLPQAAEQLAVAVAIGISRALLVVTKSDLADPEPVIAQAAAQIAQTSLGQLPAIAVSAATGAGLPELLAALGALGRGPADPDPAGPVRIWIDRAASVPGGGTVVTGTLPAGTLRQGDELVITPSMRPVRVADLQALGVPVRAASGPARVAISLRGTGREPLHRGMALAQPGRWTLTDLIDVRIAGGGSPGGGWLHGSQHGDQHGDTVTPGQLARAAALHIGSARVIARVRPLGPGLARLSLTNPLPLQAGDRVLLRDTGGRRGAVAAVAGAVVLDVTPPPLARRGAAAAAARLLATWPDQPSAADLLARHGLLRASALLAMGITDHPVPVAGEWLADPERWRSLGHQLGEALATHAAAEPLAAGMPIDAARAALDLPDRRLVIALARPPFRISCGALHIARHPGRDAGPGLPESLLAAIRVLRADLAAAPFASPDADRLRKLGLDTRSIAAAVRAGELMRISDQVVLAPGADAAAVAILAGLEQPFTAAEARQALSTTRRTAIPLLEYLDAAGLTERQPDDRRVMKAAAAPNGASPDPAAAGVPAQAAQPAQPAAGAAAPAQAGVAAGAGPALLVRPEPGS